MEKFGGENFENNLAQIEQQSEMTQEIFERLVGAQINEIRDFYGGTTEDWINNFKKKLEKIAFLAGSENAAKFYNKSVLESAQLAVENTRKNLDNLDSEKLSKEVKESLLKSLDNHIG